MDGARWSSQNGHRNNNPTNSCTSCSVRTLSELVPKNVPIAADQPASTVYQHVIPARLVFVECAALKTTKITQDFALVAETAAEPEPLVFSKNKYNLTASLLTEKMTFKNKKVQNNLFSRF